MRNPLRKMSKPLLRLEWYEIQWRWVFGGMLIGGILSGLTGALAGLVLPEIANEALKGSAMITGVIFGFEFHGKKERLNQAIRACLVAGLIGFPIFFLLNWLRPFDWISF